MTGAVFNHSLTITLHDAARVCAGSSSDMAQHSPRKSVWRNDKLLGTPPAPAPDKGAAALDLVYQAAEVFRSMEEQAREAEARAQSLCTNALERLRRAEMRAEAAERAQREFAISAERKLQEACNALEQAQSCIETQKDRLTAVELRAEVAEAEARQAMEALALVEEAIRSRLLSTNAGAEYGWSAAA